MDDIVRQALLKWPDVPDCRGWLRLTRRGEWRVPTGVIHQAGGVVQGDQRQAGHAQSFLTRLFSSMR